MRTRYSIKRKNKVLRNILSSLKKSTAKISPEIPESRASSSLSSVIDELEFCATPDSIYSGRRIFFVKECDNDDDARQFSATSISSSMLDEDDFLMSALDRMSFDIEYGDGRLYELFMAAMKEQRERVLEELHDVDGAGSPSNNATQHDTSYDLVKILDASRVEVEQEENGVTYDLVERLN